MADHDDYEVGYGKPPKRSQFKKGQSGNPKGRKKGARGLKTDLDAALSETLTIKFKGQKRSGTTQELAMLTLATRAASGDVRAGKQLADLTLSIFGAGDRQGEVQSLSALDTKLLEDLLKEPPDEPDGEAQDG